MLVIPNAYAWGMLMKQRPKLADQAAAIGWHWKIAAKSSEIDVIDIKPVIK